MEERPHQNPEVEPIGAEVFNIDHLSIDTIKRINWALRMEADAYHEENPSEGDYTDALPEALVESIRGVCARDPEKGKELLISMKDDPNDSTGYQGATAALAADSLTEVDFPFVRDLLVGLDTRAHDAPKEGVDYLELVTSAVERFTQSLTPEQQADFRQACIERRRQTDPENWEDRFSPL